MCGVKGDDPMDLASAKGSSTAQRIRVFCQCFYVSLLPSLLVALAILTPSASTVPMPVENPEKNV